jgi:hypothetical protein
VVGADDPVTPRPAVERLDREQVLAHRVDVQAAGQLVGQVEAEHLVVDLFDRDAGVLGEALQLAPHDASALVAEALHDEVVGRERFHDRGDEDGAHCTALLDRVYDVAGVRAWSRVRK